MIQFAAAVQLQLKQGIQMIDLLKNYKELRNATGYLGNVRYFLAKKKLDTLFVKWLKENKDQVEEILNKAKQGKLKASQQPQPLFPPRLNLATSLVNSSSINLGLNNTITPPRQSSEMTQSLRKGSLNMNETYNPNLAKSALMGKSFGGHHQMKIDTEKIPQFYFPDGKVGPAQESNAKEQINSIFGSDDTIPDTKAVDLVQKVLQLPLYFTPLFLKKHSKSQKKITKQQFQTYWKECGGIPIQKKISLLLTTDPNKNFLTVDNFKQLLKVIMEYHPGLQFLKSSPQFQQFYSVCVINRMFFMANRKGDFKMTFRQFKNSNILKSLYDIQAEPQINLNRDFFCYEDFYVIYITFWELDVGRRFLLNKQQFSKYASYGLSRKTVDRVFSQTAKKFSHPECMTFGDFVWFLYCAQDKTTPQSIQYWFKILDLDNNGIVTGYQLQYFYEEQRERIGYSNVQSSDYNYENIICQMIDLLKPKSGLQFTLDNFLSKRKQVGVFINIFTDLTKLQAYDQRDPYEDKALKNDHPDWTDWDRFIKPEYKRVDALDENQQQEILDMQNDQ